ncbi:DUF2855 family protein [Thalassococcus sp. S3]|uniref:DUF2855 family protein n=1 Tax=Thalassococcus sp. S3 TaxID=2017482 RepID=UPI0010242CA2|nr:DUF2855 family protein [Thalassococcus sp. S3]QBF31015.1 hypothetical protein CFI11_07250 [Thalassococcus sp. S3]
MSVTGKDLIVNRAQLDDAAFVESTFPDTPPDGQALLKIGHFALTANNITYAVAADQLGYWNFFPTEREGFGRIPVWGFADVVASSAPGVEVGTRVYGYFPMSTHVMVEPGQIKPHGFMDQVPHRQPMSPIYNQYSVTGADPSYAPEREGLISLFRPLFTTSFLLDDLHRREACFGANAVLLSSASSKTAIGLAFLLAQDKSDGAEIVGLTSPSNMAFVESLGIYDRVVSYDAVSDLAVAPAAFVDMAGNGDLLRAVHEHYGDALKNSCRVGLTHWQERELRVDGLPGPRPEFFFAPSYAQERLKEWGNAGFQSRLGKATADFLDWAAGWVNLREASGPDAVMAAYRDMLAGSIDPADGVLLQV